MIDPALLHGNSLQFTLSRASTVFGSICVSLASMGHFVPPCTLLLGLRLLAASQAVAEATNLALHMSEGQVNNLVIG